MVLGAPAHRGAGLAGYASAIGAEMGALLACAPLGPGEDFFAHGGDSLRAIALIDRLARRYRTATGDGAGPLGEALLMAVFEAATPALLAGVIAEHVDRAAPAPTPDPSSSP